jgi:putative flippase GtrA
VAICKGIFIKREKDFIRYIIYLCVGLFTGLITMAIREITARILPMDTPVYYFISILVAYFFGIIISFILNKTITFKFSTKKTKQVQLFFSFLIVAILGAILTFIFSFVFRYILFFNIWFGYLSGTISFGVGAFVSSVITYFVNVRLVFSKEKMKTL